MEVLDYLSLGLDARKEISINKKIISLVINGRECGYTLNYSENPSSSEFFRRLESLDLSNCQEKVLSDSDLSSYHIGDKDLRKISNAIHWYNKTTKTERVEDILLYSWIAIESILKFDNSVQEAIIPDAKRRSTLSVIQEVCSNVMLHNKFYNYAYDYYSYLIRNTTTYDNYFDIPKEIIENADLYHENPRKMIISKFFKHIEDIKENVNSEILKYELESLIEFYKTKDAANTYVNNVKDDILLIYRLRNLITHNATYSRMQTKLYGYKARLLCGNLIQAIKHHCKKYSISVDEAIVRLHTEHQMFMDNIIQKINDFKNG